MIVSKFANRAIAFIANDEQDRDKNYLNMRVKMNDRENLLSLLRKTGYERMPVHFSMTPDIEKRFYEYTEKTGYQVPASPFAGIPGSELLNPMPHESWKRYYMQDFAPGTSFDRYGVAREPGSAQCMHMTRMHHPLERMTTLEELKAYPFPRLSAKVSAAQKLAVKQAHSRGKFALGGAECSVWETAWAARGMEVLMMDMLADEEPACFVLDKVTNNTGTSVVNFAKAGADGIMLGDDIGMQKTIMMSGDLYRKYLKPRLKKIIDAARAVKPDIIIFYHSCGYVVPFIEDLIEAGIDVLNPVQPECMDFKELFRQYSRRLSFSGTLGTQTLMPFGTPEEIKNEITDRLDFVGPKGGLLICPTHVLEPEVPVENIVAFIDACKAYVNKG